VCLLKRYNCSNCCVVSDQGFYEYIDKANILTHLKEFLIYEDPNLRAKACSALGNMCRHSSYFYDSLVCGLLYFRSSQQLKLGSFFFLFFGGGGGEGFGVISQAIFQQRYNL